MCWAAMAATTPSIPTRTIGLPRTRIPDGGTLNIQECSSGVNCNDSLFNVVVSSSDVGGDDGSFYFPYILDPQSTTIVAGGNLPGVERAAIGRRIHRIEP